MLYYFVHTTQNTAYLMKKQEIITRFIKQARIENYSKATVKNHASSLKLFIEWVSQLNVGNISDDIQVSIVSKFQLIFH